MDLVASARSVRHGPAHSHGPTGRASPRTVLGCSRLSCKVGVPHECRPCRLQRTRTAPAPALSTPPTTGAPRRRLDACALAHPAASTP
eukprot:961222-Prymnesium_polylepis.1